MMLHDIYFNWNVNNIAVINIKNFSK